LIGELLTRSLKSNVNGGEFKRIGRRKTHWE